MGMTRAASRAIVFAVFVRMKSRRSLPPWTALFLWLWLSRAASGQDAPERALWTLWTLHQQALASADRQPVLAACERLSAAQPPGPLAAVGRGIAAWHQLKMGNTNEAVRLLKAMVESPDPDPLARAGSAMARRWLTRLDREQLRAALKAYYLAHIRYPDSLEALAAWKPSEPLPLTDRWRQPWRYRLAAFERVRGLSAQKYVLESPALAGSSDLAAALTRPYAGAIGLRPREAAEAGEGKVSVLFMRSSVSFDE